MKKVIQTFGITSLFILSVIAPLSFGLNIKESNSNVEDIESIEHIWPMFQHDSRHTGLSKYNTSYNPGHEKWKYFIEGSLDQSIVIDKDGILYTASDNKELHAVYPNGTRKWKQDDLIGLCSLESAIGKDGTIYIGTFHEFHAVYPNGTIKWVLNIEKQYVGYPTIDANDTIYVGTADGYLYAIYPNGTIKWDYFINANIRAPAVDNQGNIYFTSRDKHLYCLNPDGTLKWKSKEYTYFDNGPVIGDDGTIYLAPRTNRLYALNPDGSEKWWVELSDSEGMPAIAPDGTIVIAGKYNKIIKLNSTDGSLIWTYIVEDIPLLGWITPVAISGERIIFFAYPEYTCALNPDGSLRWKTPITSDIQPYDIMYTMASPSINKDGTVYVVSWFIRGGSNYTDYGYIHAFNFTDVDADADGPYYGLIGEPVPFEGTARWGYPPYTYHWDFGDGNTSDQEDPKYNYTETGNYTVTFTVTDNKSNQSIDTTYAWIQDGNSPPDKPIINGPRTGIPEEKYLFSYLSNDPEGTDIWYRFKEDDDIPSKWYGPYRSGYNFTKERRWWSEGVYTIYCQAKDVYEDESDWAEFTITIPRNKVIINSPLLMFLERYPLIQYILQRFGL